MSKEQRFRSNSTQIPLWIWLTLFILIILWAIWPILIKALASTFRLESQQITAQLGQIGDMYGAITSLFTLITLLLSVYINYLQFRQFNQVVSQEKMRNHSNLIDKMYRSEILDTLYMIQYDNFMYSGSTNHDYLEQYFVDKRIPREDWDSSHSKVEAKIDSLLIIFEEYLAYLNENLTKEELSTPMINRITGVLNNRNIYRYLIKLNDLYGDPSRNPYPNLIEFSNKLEREKRKGS